MKALFRNLLEIARGVLDELSDRNAYRRHLAAHGATDSPAEWRRFQDEHWGAKARRARCC